MGATCWHPKLCELPEGSAEFLSKAPFPETDTTKLHYRVKPNARLTVHGLLASWLCDSAPINDSFLQGLLPRVYAEVAAHNTTHPRHAGTNLRRTRTAYGCREPLDAGRRAQGCVALPLRVVEIAKDSGLHSKMLLMKYFGGRHLQSKNTC